MATPVPVTPFTQLMVESYVEQDKKPATGFQEFFARTNPVPTFVFNSRSVSIDIVRKGKTISEMITRESASLSLGSNAKSNVGMKWQNDGYVFPSILEESAVEWDQSLDRLPGEDPFGDTDRMERMQTLAMDRAQEDVNRIVGRLEKMAVESISTGKITLDDAAGSQYDFKRASTNTFAAPLVWTNAAATPLVDIDNVARVITQNGGQPSDFMVWGRELFDAFIRNPTVQAYANNTLNYNFVEANGIIGTPGGLDPSVSWMVGAGFTHMGNVKTPEGRMFPIFTYLAQYESTLGTFVDYFDTKGLIMGYSGARTNRYFGPSLTMPLTQIENQAMMQKIGIDVPNSVSLDYNSSFGAVDPRMFNWDINTPEGAQTGFRVRTHTNPLYVPTAVDMFGKITGVVA